MDKVPGEVYGYDCSAFRTGMWRAWGVGVAMLVSKVAVAFLLCTLHQHQDAVDVHCSHFTVLGLRNL